MYTQNMTFINRNYLQCQQPLTTTINYSYPPPTPPQINPLASRNLTLEWLFNAQKVLRFSRSTLYLAIGLLDKLITRGITLSDSNA